ncbi:MAG TPA: histone deacetylase [Planctomycetes bacterium]|nr:histone deacetylase [Planctomycetota bacterium]HIK62265.1 histone deacetylase [Planctomycetota bacterium]
MHSALQAEHDTGTGHPECAARVQAIEDRLIKSGLVDCLELSEPQALPVDALEAVHDPDHGARILAAVEAGQSCVDSVDMPISAGSYGAGLMAAGAAVAGVDQVLKAGCESTFVTTRPPGHHAEVNLAGGFCLFNNVALAARHAQAEHGLQRVAIVDWDVHHGNGTQHLFENDPSVFYASLHQFPHYPGTGARDERGLGEGEGATLNCPQDPGSGDAEWLEAFEGELLPSLESFRPDLVFVSAGFDAHARDPLSATLLTTEAYGQMTRALLQVARTLTGHGLVSLLEGGYDLEGLASSTAVHVQSLLED